MSRLAGRLQDERGGDPHLCATAGPENVAGFERWKGLKTIGIAILTCLRNGKETTEMRYYISSLGLGVKQFARAVRSHRSIENSLHWSLNVTYREDQSRIRHEHLRENFAWLN